MLITLDTTRADRLGCYGGRVAETPNLDRLAAAGVVFETAISPVPLTLPSHSSMMTGLFPHQHGVRQNGFYSLPESFTTVAEVLSARGYRTGAFLGSIILLKRFGLGQGFQTYDDPFQTTRGIMHLDERPAEQVIEPARRWVADAGTDPFFLWVHLYDAHAPYHSPDLFVRRYKENRYEAQVAYMDWALGPLIRDLEARQGPIVIVFAGDHGEALGEHGELTHGFFVYDSVQRVPLVFWAPELFPGGRRIHEQVGLPNLHRTLLELAGVEENAAQEGSAASLVNALLGGQPPTEDQLLECDTPMEQFGTAPVQALRTQAWKWIDVPRPELYDLKADPAELHNVAEQHPDVAANLRQRLAGMLENKADAQAAELQPDPALREALESLGYMSIRSKLKVMDAKLDPKDVAPFGRTLQEAREAFRRGDARTAYDLFDQVVQKCRTARSALMYRGNAAVLMRDFELARKAFMELADVFPDEASAYYNLGVAEMVLKHPEAARKALERALELDPGDADVHYSLGVACIAVGDKEAGRKHLENYLKLATDDPNVAQARTILAGLGN